MDTTQDLPRAVCEVNNIALMTDQASSALELFMLATNNPSMTMVKMTGCPIIKDASENEWHPTLTARSSDAQILILNIHHIPLSDLSDILQSVKDLREFVYQSRYNFVYDAPSICRLLSTHVGSSLQRLCLRSRYQAPQMADHCLNIFNSFEMLKYLEVSMELLMEGVGLEIAPVLPLSLKSLVLRDVEHHHQNSAARLVRRLVIQKQVSQNDLRHIEVGVESSLINRDLSKIQQGICAKEGSPKLEIFEENGDEGWEWALNPAGGPAEDEDGDR